MAKTQLFYTATPQRGIDDYNMRELLKINGGLRKGLQAVRKYQPEVYAKLVPCSQGTFGHIVEIDGNDRKDLARAVEDFVTAVQPVTFVGEESGLVGTLLPSFVKGEHNLLEKVLKPYHLELARDVRSMYSFINNIYQVVHMK